MPCPWDYRIAKADHWVLCDRLQNGSLGPERVWIPATRRFRMGNVQGGGDADEQPVHEVSLDRFAISRYEVTFAEYDRFADATGQKKPSDDISAGRGNRPVINISWENAVAYAKWLTEQTGKHYRLPTEAEWEYAARAGTETQYGWGNDIGSNQANCEDCGSQWDKKETAPVGSFAPNAFGVYDMIGNVMEWTCSKYEDKYAGAEQQCLGENDTDSDPVIRGGSYFSSPKQVRVANRFNLKLRNKRFPYDPSVGFRVVRVK
jgi:formylglycine-generating enzyme required for sulfatase activity